MSCMPHTQVAQEPKLDEEDVADEKETQRHDDEQDIEKAPWLM